MNLSRLSLLAALVAAVFSGACSRPATEKAADWQPLFDGKTFNGWRPYAKKGAPVTGWEIVDGTLHALPKVKGDQLVTEKKYLDYEFSWEWKLNPGGNNGVKYMVTEERTKSPGPEYQMIDDAAHPDGKKGADRHTAAYYDVLPPTIKVPVKVGDWNHSKIVVRGTKVEHWLNGQNVLTYVIGSPEVKKGIAESKFVKEVGFGDKIEGHILLTYHSDDCWYRNMKIREFK